MTVGKVRPLPISTNTHIVCSEVNHISGPYRYTYALYFEDHCIDYLVFKRLIHCLSAINFLISSAIFFNPSGSSGAVSAHVVVCTLSPIVTERLDAT